MYTGPCIRYCKENRWQYKGEKVSNRPESKPGWKRIKERRRDKEALDLVLLLTLPCAVSTKVPR